MRTLVFITAVIAGVPETRSRHWDYKEEKREAMEKWAAYIRRILHPSENVIKLSEARA